MINRTETEMNILLLEFKKLWKKYPEYSFGQLVVCALGRSPFYIKDDEAMRKIIELENRKD